MLYPRRPYTHSVSSTDRVFSHSSLGTTGLSHHVHLPLRHCTFTPPLWCLDTPYLGLSLFPPRWPLLSMRPWSTAFPYAHLPLIFLNYGPHLTHSRHLMGHVPPFSSSFSPHFRGSCTSPLARLSAHSQPRSQNLNESCSLFLPCITVLSNSFITSPPTFTHHH